MHIVGEVVCASIGDVARCQAPGVKDLQVVHYSTNGCSMTCRARHGADAGSDDTLTAGGNV